MAMRKHNRLHFGNRKCKKELFICQIQEEHKHLGKIISFLRLSNIINIIMIEYYRLIIFFEFVFKFFSILI